MNKVKLGDICTIKTGKVDANHATSDGKYRFYTCANQYSYCDTFSFDGENIIIPGNGDIGLVFYYNGKMEAYQRTYVLHDIKIFPRFLYYHLLYNWRYINNNKQFGSTIRYVRMSNFTNYCVEYPSLSQQEKIVEKLDELFSELDKGIETLQKTKAQLKVYKQAVLKDAFEGLDEFIILGDISISRLGKMLDKQKNKGELKPYLRNINVRWLSFNLEDLLEMRIEEDEHEKFSIKANDLVICEGGEPGRCAVWKYEDAIFYQKALHRVRFKDKCEPKLYMYYFWFLAQSGGLEKYFTGTGIKHLTGESLKKVLVPKCSIDQQQQIVQEIESRLSICDQIEKTVDESLRQAESLRQSILKQAFEGRLV